MHPKTRIAVLIAALMLGAQAGVAAIEETQSLEMTTEAAEPQADATPIEPAATTEPAAASAPAATAEPAAPSVADRAAGFMQSTASRVRGWWDQFVTAFRSGAQGARAGLTPPSTFPQGADGDVHTWLMPTQMAYLEQLEQQRAHLVARGDAFPLGSEGEELPLLMPTQVAYFERLEQQRLASLQPQPAAQAEDQPAADVQAQYGSTNLIAAHDAAAGAAQ